MSADASDAAVLRRRSFRFRPRYRALALGTAGLGALAAAAGLAGQGWFTGLAGALGLALGVAYLASPAWRLTVVVDDDGLEVVAGERPRFRLRWDEVVELVDAPASRTCFVDGGAPERSLLVPGDGAPAPYDLEHRDALYAELVARVPAARRRQVESLGA
jgi:hypothetical protein